MTARESGEKLPRIVTIVPELGDIVALLMRLVTCQLEGVFTCSKI